MSADYVARNGVNNLRIRIEALERQIKSLTQIRDSKLKPCQVCGTPVEKSFQTNVHICVDCSH